MLYQRAGRHPHHPHWTCPETASTVFSRQSFDIQIVKLVSRSQLLFKALHSGQSELRMVFRCDFMAELWKYGGESSWWFVSVPIEDANDLERFCGHRKRNFGSIRVTATIGNTSWQTSIFRDTKSSTFLLPIKALVRTKEKLVEGNHYHVSLYVD